MCELRPTGTYGCLAPLPLVMGNAAESSDPLSPAAAEGPTRATTAAWMAPEQGHSYGLRSLG